MSENVEKIEGINININNSDSSEGGRSFLDRIFDIGLKLIIPVGLILGLIAVVILVRVVLPLVNVVGELDLPLSGFGPLGAFVAGFGAFAGWIVGR